MNFLKKIIFLLILPLAAFAFSTVLNAQSIDELKQKIDDRNATIKKLEEEIKEYENQVESVNREARTLQNTEKSLDLNEKKINTDIKSTENKISSTVYTIEKLNIEISETASAIERSRASLADILRGINATDNVNFLEIMLGNKRAAEFWNDVETIERLGRAVKENMVILKELKTALENKKDEHAERKTELVDFKDSSDDKKKRGGITKTEKANLLTATKNQEANYRKILNDKIALKNTF